MSKTLSITKNNEDVLIQKTETINGLKVWYGSLDDYSADTADANTLYIIKQPIVQQ